MRELRDAARRLDDFLQEALEAGTLTFGADVAPILAGLREEVQGAIADLDDAHGASVASAARMRVRHA